VLEESSGECIIDTTTFTLRLPLDLRAPLEQCWPAALAIDEHAPLSEDLGKEQRRKLCIPQAYEVNLPPKPRFQTAPDLTQGRCFRCVDEDVDVTRTVAVAAGLRSEEDGEPERGFCAKR
jgi:hypothetical protein